MEGGGGVLSSHAENEHTLLVFGPENTSHATASAESCGPPQSGLRYE